MIFKVLKLLLCIIPIIHSLPVTPDSYLPLEPELTLTFLPPKEDNPVKFNPEEPSRDLTAPIENQEINYYEFKVPSQDLIAPSENLWNPDNDPKLYYEVPLQEAPTGEFPKKFNKEIHVKSKPYALKPKQELAIEAIEEREFMAKQKELEKNYMKQEKKINRKEIENEKEVDSLGEASEGLSDVITEGLGLPKGDGERIVFHVVGHDGPKSYKWGYDTGKGHDRMFRYEERDKTGLVTGHYGFHDKNGKLQIVHYDAHPHTGYHTESNEHS